MAIPAMPAQGAPWLTYAQALDTEARTIADKATAADITAAKARANHTGTQPAGTITGLAAVATTGAYGDLTGRPTIVELATTSETTTGTDTTRAVTPAGLKAVADTKVGLTGAETIAGTKTFSGLANFTGAVTNGKPGIRFGSDTTAEMWREAAGLIRVSGDLEALGRVSAKSTNFGTYGTPSTRRILYDFNSTMDGSVLNGTNTTDKVFMQNSVTLKGGFTNEASYGLANPGFVWGAGDFLVTGTAAGDIAGLTDLQTRLTEVHLSTPSAAINNVSALVAESGLDATATGANVSGWFCSFIARQPANGATGATIANSAAILVSSSGSNGATNEWAIYTQGLQASKFNGDILLNIDPANPKTLNAYHGGFVGKSVKVGQPSDLPTGALLGVKTAADGEVGAWIAGRGGQTGDLLRIGQDTTVHTRFDKRGRLVMSQNGAPADADLSAGQLAFYVDNTSGAMKLMIKGKDAGGTVRTAQVALA